MVEVIIVVVLILANGIFAMAEFAVVSARKTRLEQRAAKGDHNAKVALELANDPTRFLSTIQIGITLIGILTGAFGGARIAEALGDQLTQTFLGSYGDPVAFGLVIAVITYLTLVIGELLPKNLALRNPEGTAALLAPPMKLLSKVAAPMVNALAASTEFFIGLFGKGGQHEPLVTEEEIKALISVGKKTGVVSGMEADVLMRVFRAADRDVRNILTPRSQIVWVDKRMTVGEFLVFNSRQYFSHFPVCDGSLDKLIGMLDVRELLRVTGSGKVSNDDPVERWLQPAYYAVETKDVLELLEEMRRNGHTMAVVIDEFGGVSGIVTFNQLVGEIVGRIKQKGIEKPKHSLKDGIAHINGVMRVDEANRELGLHLPVGESYETVAGLIMDKLGHIPQKGERIAIGGVEMEVAEVSGPRIVKVTIIKKPV
ncbi:MAG: HlyC/CorC family transporter [Chloroflexi bacterium]|nr:HlyC/CorC family transporter [Chloroflexota bacterium]